MSKAIWLVVLALPISIQRIDTAITPMANSHDKAVLRFSNVKARFSISTAERPSSITRSKPMALMAAFKSANDISSGLKSINAVREGNETEAEVTPFKLLSFLSTLAEHAEHAIPITGIVFFTLSFLLLFPSL